MAIEHEVAEVAVDHRGDDVIVDLSGELDMDSILDLTDALTPLLTDGPFGTVRVNASKLTFCDSSGLAFILGLPHLAGAERVVVEEPSPAVQIVLEVAGLSTYLLGDGLSPLAVVNDRDESPSPS